MTRVFVEFWQHECCGEPFATGDAVTWPVVPLQRDRLVRLLGDDLGSQVRWTVQRHDEDVQSLSGTVTGIHAVFHRLERVPVHPHAVHHRAQPGSAVLQVVQGTARRESYQDLGWTGYLVDVLEDASTVVSR